MKELLKIQQELKAPKNQFNKFGNYKYRNCEDILEAVKPILKEVKCVLIIRDDIKQVGERIYVIANVELIKEDGNIIASSCAMARESLDRKGMDESQITGATSSYARKYALNGLFLIDDTKDADNSDNSQQKKAAPQKPELTPQIEAWKKAIAGLEQGTVTIAQIKNKYILSPENEKLLING